MGNSFNSLRTSELANQRTEGRLVIPPNANKKEAIFAYKDIRATLTTKQIACIILRHHNQWSLSRIGDRYGISSGNVCNLLKRAYERLRKAGITPPVYRASVSLEKKDNQPVCVTVSPHTLAERTEG